MGIPTVHLLIGPTASGKSAVALALARRRKAAILSVDSMKIYRRMNIGTAKPTATEQACVSHLLIDWKEPWERCSVADWLSNAEQTIQDRHVQGRPLIAEGGTALYLKALREGLFPGPGRSPEIRHRLEEQADRDGVRKLHQRLVQVDPTAAGRILSTDRRRIVRALEVYELSGKTISEQQVQWGRLRQDILFRTVGLELDRKRLYQRIDARVRRMIEAGWLDECRALLQLEQPLSREAAAALGYRVLFRHLRGELDLNAAIERICFDTHHFARRQLMWFRKFAEVRWVQVQADDPVEAIADRVETAWALQA